MEVNDSTPEGSGQILWEKAKGLIPGGNMLLSKRPEMFLPYGWPAYFSRASGCEVWDLDGKHYLDVSLMGVGTNILGYGNEEVDAAVTRTVSLGNMSTLNCPEEVMLAERLVGLNPWASKVRFARSGGEANAIAVRIARAFSGRDGVAVCGYHGWHDWYLAANISSSSELDGHLLPGLNPLGVPRDLAGTVFPFEHNQIEQLEQIVREQDIGVIKMEVQRGSPPESGFLQKVRSIADENEIVLIFDECTSGFRETLGGLYLQFDVEPDIAVFGKALGNGYAITSVVGREDVMQAAQNTFISSTFWTERIGPTAAIKTLEVMERTKSWEMISETGRRIKAKWLELASKYALPILVTGVDALPVFRFVESKNHQLYKTFITQEMLGRGYLATSAIYVSIAHTSEVIENYFHELEKVFAEISSLGSSGIRAKLEGPVAHDGFRRLN